VLEWLFDKEVIWDSRNKTCNLTHEADIEAFSTQLSLGDENKLKCPACVKGKNPAMVILKLDSLVTSQSPRSGESGYGATSIKDSVSRNCSESIMK
jgi:hypothetical protein